VIARPGIVAVGDLLFEGLRSQTYRFLENDQENSMSDDAKLKIVHPAPKPVDASDIEALWFDPALGDGLTDVSLHSIPVDKPKDFFRVHPEADYRPRA
jgi:hypothetical protein